MNKEQLLDKNTTDLERLDARTLRIMLEISERSIAEVRRIKGRIASAAAKKDFQNIMQSDLDYAKEKMKSLKAELKKRGLTYK